ncbi:FRG domain-containing protein [Fibrivirga algicola]|uniref:FRG domain-containing protein n=1 Tax=Fibrivirga algicola TaxID=2950420 RepID=A0ABX0QDL1_9BACT|nr:FRG domain-containing protein [Fibrivirga algicola]NID08923.1 FRG domain-containing protein [Fibrivirga algicola]
MKVLEINSFLEFHQIVENYSGSNYLFRGQTNFEWELIPKIGRPGFARTIPSVFREDYLLRSWMRYSSHIIIREPIDQWDRLSLAQHHGLATRLLDWTKNPLVALFFATFDFSSEEDASVFIFDFKNETTQTERLDPFTITFSGVFYPKGITARVISQRGVFSFSNNPQKSLEVLMPTFDFIKLKINGGAKKSIQKNLEQYGINEFSIYQDLDNLSNYLNRFVLSKEIDKII